jgi:pilus assembly protein CpaE
VRAYLTDADSEAVMRRVAANLALPGFELRRGAITEAERDLKTERSPALLFVDVSGIDRILDAVQSLSNVCEPQLQLVVVGEANDVGLFRALIAMGVADYLFKPLTAELVESVLWKLTSGATAGSDSRLGKLVAITGARGGVGVSTVAANIATYLAEKASRRVALVDLDTVTGALALMLSARPNAGLAEALDQPGRIDDLFLERATISLGPRLDLFASEQADSASAPRTAEAAEALLGRLQRSYHYVMMDVPLARRSDLHAFVESAHARLVVTEATLLALRDAGRTLQSAEAAGQRVILVQNRAGRPGDLGGPDAEAAIGRAPDLAIPFLPRAFGSALNLGVPAWRRDGRIETAVGLMARELSGQGVRAAPVPRWKRMLGLHP